MGGGGWWLVGDPLLLDLMPSAEKLRWKPPSEGIGKGKNFPVS